MAEVERFECTLKIQFVELDFSNLIFEKSSKDGFPKSL